MEETNSTKEKSPFSSVMTLILICFFFSGMTGLIYEILWTRMIVKIIGAAPFAVSIILTVFMGGLGLGSFLAGKTTDLIKHPLKLVRMYGILELAVGVYCLLLPMILTNVKPICEVIYNSLFNHFMLYSFLTFVVCSVLLILPVICMGATLPILCRFYVSRMSHLANRIGRLYGLNTIGAAVGSLLCGFWLINYLGMTGALVFAATINLVIGLVSIVASYKFKTDEGQINQAGEDAFEQSRQEAAVSTYKGTIPAALIIFAVSGFCAMSYEVIWTKLLGLVIGPTTYSFTIVLVTFITCLALGSIFFGWLGDKVEKPIWLLIYTQLAAVLLAMFVSQLLGNSQFFFAKLIYTFQNSFILLSVSKAIILFAFMFLPTVCLGATFPLVGKVCTPSLSRVGKSIGFAYMVNTTGAVLGSFSAGFLLLPLMGKENGLKLVFGIQIFTTLIIAAWLVWINKQDKAKLASVVAPATLGVILCLIFPRWNRASLSMGKYHRLQAISSTIKKTGWLNALWNGSDILDKYKLGKVVYYGDGVAGFTTVLEVQDELGEIDYFMTISGKPDAGTTQDMPTQVLSAHLPIMFHPNPKTVMVLGLASGITAGEALCYPVERLDILEISNQVVEASRFFDQWNGNVLSDPRTDLIIQDGRAHLLLTDRKYDVIISEPSNPWMAGLAALFTKDFFELARDRLYQDGMFAQFIHSYQMDWPSFSMVVRTFANIFPNSVLINTSSNDYLMVGFKGDNGLILNNTERNFQFAQKSQNMTLLNPKSLYGLIVTEDLNGLCGPGPINTDTWPRLEFSAPKTMFASDPAIQENIYAKRSLKSETLSVLEGIIPDVNAQIDFAVLNFSLNTPRTDIINLANATPEQMQRYAKIVTDYCSSHLMDCSILQDETLIRECRSIQIKAIEEKLNTLEDKAAAYYALGTLSRENELWADAEKHYHKALELKPDQALLYNDLGVVLNMQGKLNEAITYYNKALQISPDLQGTRYNLDKALTQQRELYSEPND
ncbi:MAG: fused MFS/spermidine synthase [Planctomycetota bacterium]